MDRIIQIMAIILIGIVRLTGRRTVVIWISVDPKKSRLNYTASIGLDVEQVIAVMFKKIYMGRR